MERVWEELKEIENKAEQINSETMKKSHELIAVAKKDAEKLLSQSKKHAEAETIAIYGLIVPILLWISP